MNATGLGVTPKSLTGAAAAIDAAVRGGGLGDSPTPAGGPGYEVSVAGGPGYGHPGAADSVARFGSAIGEATRMLLASASRASTGLRAGAGAYLAQERSACAGLSPEQAG